MKQGIILLGFVALLNTACSTPVPKNAEFCQMASVALVPAGNVDVIRAKCAELEAGGAIRRGGLYLRVIEGKTYLFQYLEPCCTGAHKKFQGLEEKPGGDSTSFQGLEKLVEPLPEAVRKGLLFEPMEQIFHDAGASGIEPEGDAMHIAMFTELKRDKEAHYRLLHANPWPDVIAAIKKANFRNFSIFLEEINGHIYLFGWLEYVGTDLAADDAGNKKDPASIRWWKETDACQIAPPDADGGMWGGMEELLFVRQHGEKGNDGNL